MEIVSLYPKGICEGVANAFDIANKAIKENKGQRIYLVGSLIHNEIAMKPLLANNVVLLNEKDGSLLKQMESLEDGSILIYSAHGHDEETYEEIRRRKNFIVYDASCRHIKDNLRKMKEAKGKIAFLGDLKHLEAIAAESIENVTVLDYKNPAIDYYDYVVSQTSLDEDTVNEIEDNLKKVNPNIVSLKGRCPSSIMRQKNVLAAPKDIDLFIVIGSKDSANTKRLATLAKESHKNADVFQVLDINDVKSLDLRKYKKTALCSGASSLDAVYDEIEGYLRSL